MGGGRIRRAARRLFATGHVLPRDWTHCPLCGIETSSSIMVAMRLTALTGPLWWVPTQDDLVAACPLHRMLADAERPHPCP